MKKTLLTGLLAVATLGVTSVQAQTAESSATGQCMKERVPVGTDAFLNCVNSKLNRQTQWQPSNTQTINTNLCTKLKQLESNLESSISSAKLSIYTAAPGDGNQAHLIPQLSQQLFNVQLKQAELGCN